MKVQDIDGSYYYYDIAICDTANNKLAKQDAKYLTAGVVQWEQGKDGQPEKPHKVGDFKQAEVIGGSK